MFNNLFVIKAQSCTYLIAKSISVGQLLFNIILYACEIWSSHWSWLLLFDYVRLSRKAFPHHFISPSLYPYMTACATAKKLFNMAIQLVVHFIANITCHGQSYMILCWITTVWLLVKCCHVTCIQRLSGQSWLNWQFSSENEPVYIWQWCQSGLLVYCVT